MSSETDFLAVLKAHTVVPHLTAIAIYENADGHVAIRQGDPDNLDEYQLVVVPRSYLPNVIGALKAFLQDQQ